MNESEAFIELFGRVAEHVHARGRRAHRGRPRLVAGTGRELHRLAGLALDPRPGRPRRRPARRRAAVDHRSMGVAVRPRRPTRATPATATPPTRSPPCDPTAPRCWSSYYDAVAARTNAFLDRLTAGRARPGRRRTVGSARDDGCPPGEHRRRRHPTRRTGRLPAGPPAPHADVSRSAHAGVRQWAGLGTTPTWLIRTERTHRRPQRMTLGEFVRREIPHLRIASISQPEPELARHNVVAATQ